jgi:hypothetical protein
MIDIAAEVSVALAPVLAELAAVRAELAAVRASLPSQWISLRDAAERMGVDPRTVVSMGERGDIVTRKAGRRRLVLGSSLAPVDQAVVAAAARRANRS